MSKPFRRLPAAVLSVFAVAAAAGLIAFPSLAQEDTKVFPAYKSDEADAVEATAAPAVSSPNAPLSTRPGSYKIQAGDELTISVWKEPDLLSDVFVRPDGGISIPLAGDLPAAGHTTEELRAKIEERLHKFIPDPVVTVSVKLISGNRIYVVGKVNKPGDFPLTGDIDVMQSLGLAGGATPFASLDHIRVLRRENGKELSIRFRYSDIESGKSLEQNILLHSGDTVVVP